MQENTYIKWVYIFGSVLLLIALVGYVYQGVSEEQASQTLVSDRAFATLTPLSLDVFIATTSDEEGWEVIDEASSITDGTGVRTSALGRAIISHEEKIITSLDNNSEIYVRLSEDSKQTKIEVTLGNTWSKIGRALEQDEVYEVYTPTMVAAVRGTSFGVRVDDIETLIVTEGAVEVFLRDKETGDAITASRIRVIAGQTVEVIEGEFSVRPTSKEDRDAWYVEHNPETELNGEVATSTTSDGIAPAPLPQLPSATDLAPETKPVEIKKLSITKVEQSHFVYDRADRVIFWGENLAEVKKVTFNGNMVEFHVTDKGVLVVEMSELRNRDEVYDVVLQSDHESVTLQEAITVEKSVPPVTLVITDISVDTTSTQERSAIVSGSGMDIVDTVTVNGEDVAFRIVSDTELHIFKIPAGTGGTVLISGGDHSATGSL